jgi:hypothetical protein
MAVGFTTSCATESVQITTKVVSSNPAHDEVYSIQHYVMKFVSHGYDHIVVGFTTAYAISVCHHYRCEFKSHSWRGVPETSLCDKVCEWLVAGRWFSPDTPVSSTNKTERNDITDILLKVALSTIISNTWNVKCWSLVRFWQVLSLNSLSKLLPAFSNRLD